ncbi:uncharacterized protein EDB91DRAFT_1090172 [Suillus paluster]|uniref:uncharacterized protein n=1 Tax=Suillus paluster TaxID=48578 RepID=UPI001B86452A|nr:uncharacterized protein EDB91DRAFT_1090172 [Suillus paluster]KAG1718272.1 hypothetical protein EDB91DRAFT_1090172 [Suillus paluster]
MTPIPTDWALHTTCIAADFVHQLFACHVGNRQPLASPPLALDVPTMLACRQLARVLANASQQLLEKPSVLMDSGGRIILWYLLDTISPVDSSQDGSSHGRDGLPPENKHHQWTRVQLENILRSFSHERLPPANPRMHQHSPLLCQPYGFPPAGGFTPEVSATLKGEGGPKVIISMQRSALLASAALRVMHPELYWASVTTQMKLTRWAMENELDGISTPEGFDVMTSVGHYCDGFMTLSNLGIQLQYNSGAMVGCSGHIVRHGVTFRGDRFVWAWFMRDSLHNFVGTPWSEYAKYKDVDWDVSVSA